MTTLEIRKIVVMDNGESPWNLSQLLLRVFSHCVIATIQVFALKLNVQNVLNHMVVSWAILISQSKPRNNVIKHEHFITSDAITARI